MKNIKSTEFQVIWYRLRAIICRTPFRERCASIRHGAFLFFCSSNVFIERMALRDECVRDIAIHGMRFVSFIRIRFFIINNRRPKKQTKKNWLFYHWRRIDHHKLNSVYNRVSTSCELILFSFYTLDSYLERIRSNSCVIARAPCLNPSHVMRRTSKWPEWTTTATNSFVHFQIMNFINSDTYTRSEWGEWKCARSICKNCETNFFLSSHFFWQSFRCCRFAFFFFSFVFVFVCYLHYFYVCSDDQPK